MEIRLKYGFLIRDELCIYIVSITNRIVKTAGVILEQVTPAVFI